MLFKANQVNSSPLTRTTWITYSNKSKEPHSEDQSALWSESKWSLVMPTSAECSRLSTNWDNSYSTKEPSFSPSPPRDKDRTPLSLLTNNKKWTRPKPFRPSETWNSEAGTTKSQENKHVLKPMKTLSLPPLKLWSKLSNYVKTKLMLTTPTETESCKPSKAAELPLSALEDSEPANNKELLSYRLLQRKLH